MKAEELIAVSSQQQTDQDPRHCLEIHLHHPWACARPACRAKVHRTAPAQPTPKRYENLIQPEAGKSGDANQWTQNPIRLRSLYIVIEVDLAETGEKVVRYCMSECMIAHQDQQPATS